jgi:hypothetical protein
MRKRRGKKWTTPRWGGGKGYKTHERMEGGRGNSRTQLAKAAERNGQNWKAS